MRTQILKKRVDALEADSCQEIVTLADLVKWFARGHPGNPRISRQLRTFFIACDPIGLAVMAIAKDGGFEGSLADFLEDLCAMQGVDLDHPPWDWPENTDELCSWMHQITSGLRRNEVMVEIDDDAGTISIHEDEKIEHH
jgi:hypothetical protein